MIVNLKSLVAGEYKNGPGYSAFYSIVLLSAVLFFCFYCFNNLLDDFGM